MLNISAVVLSKNEELKIADCLKSLSGLAEIIIVDDESTDRTVAIAKKFTDKVFINKLTDFSRQRNYGAGLCANRIILQLDADERLTEELKNEIEQAINKDNFSAAAIPRKNFIAGKFLIGGGFGPRQDYQSRLYDKEKCHWAGLVHETLTCPDKFKLNNPIMHYSKSTISEYLRNFDDWTDLTALEKKRLGIKFNLFKLYFYPIAEFLRRYVILGGFLDGIIGLKLALIQAKARRIIELKLK